MTSRAVCFDAADTLFTERTSRAAMYAEVFADFGAPVETAAMGRWMGAVHDELPADVGGAVRYTDAWFRAYLGRLLERAGSPADPERVRRVLADRFTRVDSYLVYGDVFGVLEDLTAAGRRLAVVSNWSDRLPGLLQDLGLARYFEVLAVSASVGVAKPSSRLFLHALERLDVPPAEALHVGNDPLDDVEGARAAGLAAVLLDRGSPAPGPGAIGSLEELPGLLGL